RRRVSVAQVVSRFDESATEHGLPESVDDRFGEVWIARGREPVGERGAAVGRFFEEANTGDAGDGRLAGAGVGHGPAGDHFDLSTAVEAGGDRGKGAGVGLRPAGARGGVAVCAPGPNAAEKPAPPLPAAPAG